MNQDFQDFSGLFGMGGLLDYGKAGLKILLIWRLVPPKLMSNPIG